MDMYISIELHDHIINSVFLSLLIGLIIGIILGQNADIIRKILLRKIK